MLPNKQLCGRGYPLPVLATELFAFHKRKGEEQNQRTFTNIFFKKRLCSTPKIMFVRISFPKLFTSNYGARMSKRHQYSIFIFHTHTLNTKKDSNHAD